LTYPRKFGRSHAIGHRGLKRAHLIGPLLSDQTTTQILKSKAPGRHFVHAFREPPIGWLPQA
jgi:hypothetical protein